MGKDSKIKIVRMDHRRSPRREPSEDLLGVVKVGTESYPTRILDYSPKGVSLQFENDFLPPFQGQRYEVELQLKKTIFKGHIRHSRQVEGVTQAGVLIDSMEAPIEVSFTDVDPGWDLVEDQETIDNLFSDLAFKGPEILIKLRQIQGHAEVFAKEVKDGELILEVHELRVGELQEGFANLRFEMFQTSHAFDTRVTWVKGGLLAVSIPPRVARLLRRETVRVQNGTNGRFITAHLKSSVLGESRIDMDIYDLSEHGLAILDPDLWLHAPLGVPIEEITLTTSNGKTIRGSGHIRGHQWVFEKNQFTTGIVFKTATSEDRNKWHNFILECRYPLLSFDYEQKDHEQIWDLFERSNYLHLKGKEAYTHIIDLTRQTWEKLESAGTKWSKRPLIRLNDTVVGHIQLDQIYPDTWCVHHLAIDPKISKLVAKELYAVTTDVMLAEEGGFLINFTEVSKPWNQRTYYDFVSEYRYPEHNELEVFQIHSVSVDKYQKNKDSEVKANISNSYDLARIFKYYEIHTSKLEREATSLGEGELKFEKFKQEIAAVGLSRDREYAAAYINDEFCGFARMEIGSEGVNIVGVLDMCYMYIVPGFENFESKIYDSLLSISVEYYKTKSKQSFLIASKDKRKTENSDVGVSYVTEAMRWIASRAILPRYHAFSQLLYGHLQLRKEKIRHKRLS